jgi:hypothetical protein
MKMLLSQWVHIPIQWSLGVIVALLGGSILISWFFDPKKKDEPGSPDASPPPA